MASRRWIYINGEAIEITEGYSPSQSHDAKNFVVGDRHYEGLRSPRGDQADISTRTKHREYMKQHGLATADDFKETWAKAAEKRKDFFAGKDPSRVNDVVRAVDKVQQGYRPLVRHED